MSHEPNPYDPAAIARGMDVSRTNPSDRNFEERLRKAEEAQAHEISAPSRQTVTSRLMQAASRLFRLGR